MMFSFLFMIQIGKKSNSKACSLFELNLKGLFDAGYVWAEIFMSVESQRNGFIKYY